VLNDVQGGFHKPDRPMVGKPVEDALSVAPRKDHTGTFEKLQVAADDRRVLMEMRGYLAEAPLAFGQQFDDVQSHIITQSRKQGLRHCSARLLHHCTIMQQSVPAVKLGGLSAIPRG
jgi:hypothetical protein